MSDDSNLNLLTVYLSSSLGGSKQITKKNGGKVVKPDDFRNRAGHASRPQACLALLLMNFRPMTALNVWEKETMSTVTRWIKQKEKEQDLEICVTSSE